MADTNRIPDTPESMALPGERLREIARSLAIEGRGEIEDARGFPILDRAKYDALGDQLTDGFAQVLAAAYRQSWQPSSATVARLHRGSRAEAGEAKAA